MILLYEDIFDCPEEIEAAKKVGFEIQSFSIHTCFAGDLPSECFIFRGSLEGLAWLDRIKHPYYIKLSNINEYKISNYFFQFKERMLNKDFVILPAGAVRESKDRLFKMFGGDRLFIKPNDGNKLFTGCTITEKWFDKELDIIFHDLSHKEVMSSDLLFISSYKDVEEEVRYVVNDGIVSDLDYPEWLKEAVENSSIVDYYYTIDITGDKIVEINCMSCSGLEDSFEKVYRSLWDFYVQL